MTSIRVGSDHGKDEGPNRRRCVKIHQCHGPRSNQSTSCLFTWDKVRNWGFAWALGAPDLASLQPYTCEQLRCQLHCVLPPHSWFYSHYQTEFTCRFWNTQVNALPFPIHGSGRTQHRHSYTDISTHSWGVKGQICWRKRKKRNGHKTKQHPAPVPCFPASRFSSMGRNRIRWWYEQPDPPGSAGAAGAQQRSESCSSPVSSETSISIPLSSACVFFQTQPKKGRKDPIPPCSNSNGSVTSN